MWPHDTEPQRIDWRPGSLVVPPLDCVSSTFLSGTEAARFIALKPWGFKYLVDDLPSRTRTKTKAARRSNTKIKIQKFTGLFVDECTQRGVLAQMPMFA